MNCSFRLATSCRRLSDSSAVNLACPARPAGRCGTRFFPFDMTHLPRAARGLAQHCSIRQRRIPQRRNDQAQLPDGLDGLGTERRKGRPVSRGVCLGRCDGNRTGEEPSHVLAAFTLS
jgi:hypothetical protein